MIDRDAYLRDGIVVARGLLAHDIDAIRGMCEPLTELETQATAPFAYHVAASGVQGTVVGKVEAYREAYPELERRKSRGLSYGEASERAKHEQARSLDDDAAFYLDNAAFYLIEREAIELRRLRWRSSEEHKRV